MAGEGLNTGLGIVLRTVFNTRHYCHALNDRFCMERGFASLGSRLLKDNKSKTQR